jgi:hypothetical protein
VKAGKVGIAHLRFVCCVELSQVGEFDAQQLSFLPFYTTTFLSFLHPHRQSKQEIFKYNHVTMSDPPDPAHAMPGASEAGDIQQTSVTNNNVPEPAAPEAAPAEQMTSQPATVPPPAQQSTAEVAVESVAPSSDPAAAAAEIATSSTTIFDSATESSASSDGFMVPPLKPAAPSAHTADAASKDVTATTQRPAPTNEAAPSHGAVTSSFTPINRLDKTRMRPTIRPGNAIGMLAARLQRDAQKDAATGEDENKKPMPQPRQRRSNLAITPDSNNLMSTDGVRAEPVQARVTFTKRSTGRHAPRIQSPPTGVKMSRKKSGGKTVTAYQHTPNEVISLAEDVATAAKWPTDANGNPVNVVDGKAAMGKGEYVPVTSNKRDRSSSAEPSTDVASKSDKKGKKKRRVSMLQRVDDEGDNLLSNDDTAKDEINDMLGINTGSQDDEEESSSEPPPTKKGKGKQREVVPKEEEEEESTTDEEGNDVLVQRKNKPSKSTGGSVPVNPVTNIAQQLANRTAQEKKDDDDVVHRMIQNLGKLNPPKPDVSHAPPRQPKGASTSDTWDTKINGKGRHRVSWPNQSSISRQRSDIIVANLGKKWNGKTPCAEGVKVLRDIIDFLKNPTRDSTADKSLQQGWPTHVTMNQKFPTHFGTRGLLNTSCLHNFEPRHWEIAGLPFVYMRPYLWEYINVDRATEDIAETLSPWTGGVSVTKPATKSAAKPARKRAVSNTTPKDETENEDSDEGRNLNEISLLHKQKNGKAHAKAAATLFQISKRPKIEPAFEDASSSPPSAELNGTMRVNVMHDSVSSQQGNRGNAPSPFNNTPQYVTSAQPLLTEEELDNFIGFMLGRMSRVITYSERGRHPDVAAGISTITRTVGDLETLLRTRLNFAASTRNYQDLLNAGDIAQDREFEGLSQQQGKQQYGMMLPPQQHYTQQHYTPQPYTPQHFGQRMMQRATDSSSPSSPSPFMMGSPRFPMLSQTSHPNGILASSRQRQGNQDPFKEQQHSPQLALPPPPQHASQQPPQQQHAQQQPPSEPTERMDIDVHLNNQGIIVPPSEGQPPWPNMEQDFYSNSN